MLGTRIKEHNLWFKSKNLKSKFVSHAIETDHSPNFTKTTIIQRTVMFIEVEFSCDIYSAINPSNKAGNIPSGYSILW